MYTIPQVVRSVSKSLPLLFSKKTELFFQENNIEKNIFFYIFRMIILYDFYFSDYTTSYFADACNIPSKNMHMCDSQSKVWQSTAYIEKRLVNIHNRFDTPPIIKIIYFLARSLSYNDIMLGIQQDGGFFAIQKHITEKFFGLVNKEIDNLHILMRYNINQKILDSFFINLKKMNSNYDAWFPWYQYKCGYLQNFVYPYGYIIQFDHDVKNIDNTNHKIKMYFNHFNIIPMELRNPHNLHIVDEYLYALPYIEKKLNIVRAIFIGHGASGKTSLIRTLYNETVMEGKEKMTPGIEIRELPIANTVIKAKLWDFGGQVMTHATHQFFLRERCLYVLVIDARAEINSNEQAEYWLEHIKAFGNSASVIIVGNKSDNVVVNLDMNALSEKYPNIVGFYPLSCTQYQNDGTYRHQYELFKESFTQELLKVDTHQVYFTQGQFTVLQSLRELSANNAFISQDEFMVLCDEHEIGKVGLNRDAYLSLLDSLGEVIHFPNIPFLDAYILNPRWLTYGVYTLLFSDKANENGGYLSEADVVSILSSKSIEDEHGNRLSYPPNKCSFIIDAMEEFKLCYRLPHNRKELVIPDKLLAQQPKLDFDKNDERAIAFEFDFKSFLPRHIMPTFIVSRHEEIKENLVWQNGVVLYSTEYLSTARIQVDYHERVLKIWVQGEYAKDYLFILRGEISKILTRMESLEYKEMVVLPKSTCLTPHLLASNQVDKIAYKMLLSIKRNGDKYCYSETGVQYDIDKVFGEVIVEKKTNNIFIINQYKWEVINKNNHGNIVKMGSNNIGTKINQS